MNIKNKFKWILVFFFLFQTHSNAQTVYYLDFKYILNQSEAGKKAQTTLKNKLDKDSLKTFSKLVPQTRIFRDKTRF